MLLDLGAFAPQAAMALLALVFLVFMLEIRSPDMVAFCGAVGVLVLSLATVEDVLTAVASPAPATIGRMFVLSAALVCTGVLEAASDLLRTRIRSRPRRTLQIFFAVAAAASAFMNSTPVVLVLIPVVVALAREIGIARTRLLIPLSYMVILGGTCTLIGTSTTLLIDGLTMEMGFAPFGRFEIAPLGLAIAMIGGGFLTLVGPWLLPSMARDDGILPGAPQSWLEQLFVLHGAAVIGPAPLAVEEFRRGGNGLVDLIRVEDSLRDRLDAARIEAGGVVVLRSPDSEVLGSRGGQAEGESSGSSRLGPAVQLWSRSWSDGTAGR